MSDENGTTTTTTIWQDPNSGLRRHKLMTKELGENIPALYANENVAGLRLRPRPRQALQPLQRLDLVHHRVGVETGLCFGLVQGFEEELGYFDLDELAGGDRVRRRPRRGARPLLGHRRPSARSRGQSRHRRPSIGH